MPSFPSSTGNFIMTLGSTDYYDFYLRQGGLPGSAINLTSCSVVFTTRHQQIQTIVGSFTTLASSARLSVTGATSGAVRFAPMSGDYLTSGKYDYRFIIWDSSSKQLFVPDHTGYIMHIIDIF